MKISRETSGLESRPAFVFDPDRCTGCEACRIACGIENNEGRDTGWRTVMSLNPSRHPALPTHHLSLACNHCDTPVCALGCPANAYDRDLVTGAVILDPDKCIGCRFCSWLCPYDAPQFDERAGVMTKCTFCSPRLAAGGEPACTQACPTDALSLGERTMDAPEPIFAGLGSTGLGPALKVVETRRSGLPPALAIDAIIDANSIQPRPARKLGLRSEWTLLLFTIIMPILVAWFGAGLVITERAPSPIVFLGLIAVAMTLSTMHLGKPLRAFRAILNLRTSWLSREILFANLFLVAGTTCLLAPELETVGWFGFVAGIGLLVSIDRVYGAIPRTGGYRMHSSEAVLTVVLFLGIVTGTSMVAWSAAAVKIVMFVTRWRRGEMGLSGSLAVARTAFLVGASFATIPWSLAFVCAILGEVIDRSAFYIEIEPSSPRGRMAIEVRTAFARMSEAYREWNTPLS